MQAERGQENLHLRRKLKKEFNVKIIDHKSNKGLSAARNSGVKEATGEWVYFLDSDDEITPDCIECFVRLAERYLSVDFIVGGIRVIEEIFLIDLLLLNML